MSAAANPVNLIDAYVADVIKRLPGKLRSDVGFELRALLHEELKGRAGGAGGSREEAMTLALLRDFGRPDDVAARYHPPGISIIPPTQTKAFAWATAIGLALQWAVTLPLAMGAGEGQVGRWLGRWWLTYGLGAFWWPGFLVTMMLGASFIRQRWPAAFKAWTPNVVDRDHINRPWYMAGLALALLGIGLWVLLAWSTTTTRATTPFAQVMQLDPDFLATRAPVVLLYWTASVVLLLVVTLEGRWRQLTRRIDLAMKLACCVMLAWLVVGGRIFVTEATNTAAQAMLGLLILVLVADVVWKAWRDRSQIHTPREVVGQKGRGPC